MKHLCHLALLITLFGCSSTYHFKRILKKNPDFFKVDTTTVISKKIVPSVTTSFDCDLLTKSSLNFDVPVLLPSGKVDTVFVEVKKNNQNEVEASIDCPDVEVIERLVPEPYPVYVQPTTFEKLKMGFYGLLLSIGIFSFIALGRWIRNKVSG